ncbi:MAG: replication initiator, partial [Pseudonocardia sp.]
MSVLDQTTPALVGAPAPGTDWVDQEQLTRAQKALLALSGDVAKQLAEDHGVCVRPMAMRRLETSTGRVDVVPVPCGARDEAKCRPCAEKARRLRMVQCREGWHLEDEPNPPAPVPTERQKGLLATRADLHARYTLARELGDAEACEEIRDIVAELDTEIRGAGIRGRLVPLDPENKARKRSTRRRQDAPNLPRRPVENRTLGRVYGGRYRPSTFLTLTLDSYGRVDQDGAALDPDSYDYRRAARDAIHFPRLVDRFWQNTRRCVGWDVQYFGTVEPQKRGAPHFHAAVRGTIPRAELRAIAAATYHGVYWPAHDEIRYTGDRMPRWDDHQDGFVDPDTREPLPTFDEATD